MVPLCITINEMDITLTKPVNKPDAETIEELKRSLVRLCYLNNYRIQQLVSALNVKGMIIKKIFINTTNVGILDVLVSKQRTQLK